MLIRHDYNIPNQYYVQWILMVDLFTSTKYVTKPILLFNDNIVLIQTMFQNVFTTCTYITICKLPIT